MQIYKLISITHIKHYTSINKQPLGIYPFNIHKSYIDKDKIRNII